MLRREALNVAGICDQSDRFNCKYCRRAGRDCEGATGIHSRHPSPGVVMRGAEELKIVGCYFAASSPRHNVSEEYFEYTETPPYIHNGLAVDLPGPEKLVKVWRYHYSDGTSEDVLKREPLS